MQLILHGENASLNFNQMIIMASLINNQPLNIDNTPSDSTQEPNEDIIILNTIKSIKNRPCKINTTSN